MIYRFRLRFETLFLLLIPGIGILHFGLYFKCTIIFRILSCPF